MRILHTYCLNYNLGDHALGLGVKNILRHCLDVDCIAETNLQGQIFDKKYIDVINRNYELLVIGGGGIIHGAHWPQGWFWLIEKEDIKKIHIPFIIFAAGYNYFKGEKPIPQRGIDHLKVTQDQALYFSVRNDGSFERLRDQTGIEAKILPDPGFWVSVDRNYHKPINEPYVMMQLANDKADYRYGNVENRFKFIQNIRKVIKHIAENYKVIIAPHVLADIEISEEVAHGIDNVSLWDFGRFAFDRTDESLGYYKYAEFTLAMRGHGQILPLGFGVPVISLENHEKNLGLMKNIGLEKYNVDVNDTHFVEKVISLITDIKDNNQIRIQIEKNNEGMLQDTINQFNYINSLF